MRRVTQLSATGILIAALAACLAPTTRAIAPNEFVVFSQSERDHDVQLRDEAKKVCPQGFKVTDKHSSTETGLEGVSPWQWEIACDAPRNSN
jgi:hypothetical protein